MKNKIIFSMLATVVAFAAYAQEETVHIPNSLFKTYLLSHTDINTNADNEIQVSEAAAFAGTIDLTNKGIPDLTGIEAFTSLTELKIRSNTVTSLDLSRNTALIRLYAQSNKLTALDVSNNTDLIFLECSYNQLTSLDVSVNLALKTLNCMNNKIATIDVSNNTTLNHLTIAQNLLSSLDVTHNTILTYLSCYNNQLTALDVSHNPDLQQLACGNNKLESLDISGSSPLFYLACFNNKLTSLNIANGNNHHFNTLNTSGNPDLACIQVDDKAYSDANWTGGSLKKDDASVFSEDCNPLTTNITGSTAQNFLIYPNPTNGLVHFPEYANVQIMNSFGQLIAEKKNTKSFDFSGQPASMYFILFTDELGQTKQRSKITKE